MVLCRHCCVRRRVVCLPTARSSRHRRTVFNCLSRSVWLASNGKSFITRVQCDLCRCSLLRKMCLCGRAGLCADPLRSATERALLASSAELLVRTRPFSTGELFLHYSTQAGWALRTSRLTTVSRRERIGWSPAFPIETTSVPPLHPPIITRQEPQILYIFQ